MIKDRVKHVDELSKNTQLAWFAALALMAFSLVAVAGVRDRDFFVGVRTELPLLGVSVPTVAFFIVTPVILLAGYLYFLFHIVKLSTGFAELPIELPSDSSGETVPLSQAVQPGLISEALLANRSGAPPSEFEGFYPFAVLMFAWWAVPLMLLVFWVRSWPDHNFTMTAFVATLLVLALVVGRITYGYVSYVLKNSSASGFQLGARGIGLYAATLAIILGLTSFAVTRGFTTQWPFIWQSDLYQVEIVERPTNWLPREQAEREFLADYANVSREELDKILIGDANLVAERFSKAREQFIEHRNHFLLSLDRPDLKGADLRVADMRYSFLPAVDLRDADLRGARLFSAEMEGALMGGVDLTGAALGRSHLSCARLEKSHLRSAYLVQAQLDRATLTGADLRGANLREANLSGADLEEAKLSGANLSGADLSNVFLSNKDIEGAIADSETILPPNTPPLKLATCFVDLDRSEIARISKVWRVELAHFIHKYSCRGRAAETVVGPSGPSIRKSQSTGRCWPVGEEEVWLEETDPLVAGSSRP